MALSLQLEDTGCTLLGPTPYAAGPLAPAVWALAPAHTLNVGILLIKTKRLYVLRVQ